MPQSVDPKKAIADPISVAAHQLKNPIATLRTCIEILISGDVGTINAKQKEYLNDSLENINKMAELINNFLDMSKIEEKRYEVRPSPIDFSKLVQDIVKDFFYLAKASNCEIIFNKPQDFPFVFADSFKIRQVIENLISNAIRYKSPGRGKIEIGMRKDGNKVIFSCEDNGIGIPDFEAPKVFSKFYRSEDALKIDPTGSGLGLFIDKAVIDLSGGKIWFEKNKDKGVTFYFTLPILV